MKEKRSCPNCGAYLSEEDKVCYVCGEVVPVLKQPEKEDVAPVETEENYVDNAPTVDEPIDDSYDYFDEDNSEEYEDYQEYDEPTEKPRKSTAKKIAIICGICVGVVAIIAAAVCICAMNGIFTPTETQQEMTLYFDKPNSNVYLMETNGTAYNWGADVSVYYSYDGESQEKPCKISDEYENIWEVTIPAQAEDIYFYQSTGSKIRTQTLTEPQDCYIYYVVDPLLDEKLRLSVDSCPIQDFGNNGINYSEETQETTVETEETTASTEEESSSETEATTEEITVPLNSKAYSVSVPSQWKGKVTKVEAGNCVTYYQTYSFENNGDGNLVSIYVFDANDNSYTNMNVVRIVESPDKKRKIVAVTPRDIPCDDQDEKLIEEYIKLTDNVDDLVNSITAK
ncbi:MAG: hypothetical protein PUD53_05155 [Oscillospiraceae bacterium]|nr:hypothetical protein [Oscillospiraceae bacterium]